MQNIVCERCLTSMIAVTDLINVESIIKKLIGKIDLSKFEEEESTE